MIFRKNSENARLVIHFLTNQMQIQLNSEKKKRNSIWQVPRALPHIPELYHPPGEQQVFGNDRFFIGDVPIVLGSRAWTEIFQRFR